MMMEMAMLKNTMMFRRKLKEQLITKTDKILFYTLDGVLSVLFYFATGMIAFHKFDATVTLIIWIILFIFDFFFAYITRTTFFIYSQIQKYYER